MSQERLGSNVLSYPINHSHNHTNIFDVNHSTMPYILSFLSDRDTLLNFLPCHCDNKPLVKDYMIQSTIDVSRINTKKYANYRFSSVKNISSVEQLEHLSKSVRRIQFSRKFNQPLQIGVFPPSVKYLEFGFAFNQPLQAGVIPQSVTHFKFGHEFNQPLQVGVIPRGVRDLTFGWKFNQPLSKFNIEIV